MNHTLSGLLGRALASRHAAAAIIGFALLLTTPSLTVGLVVDDVVHQVMLREPPGYDGIPRGPFDLFRFASGDASAARRLMNDGVFPWWTDPGAVLAFFRPVSSLTHWVDYRVWPDSPWLMHLHSMAWFALLLCVVSVLYRRFESSRPLADLALLLYAVDDARGPVVAWLANRNAMVALACSLPALIAHDKWRRDGHRPSAWLGPLSLAVGLLAGESAIAVVGYLVAYAWFFEQGRWRSRVLSLAGYGVIVLVWLVAYRALGYGAAGSGIYLDPGRQPAAFAAAATSRLPVLLLSQFALPWADGWEVYPMIAPCLRWVVMGLAVALILTLIGLVTPLWRKRRSVRFWAVGTVLALLPVCATFPHDRLLMGAGVGGMALLSQLFAHGWLGTTQPRRRFGAWAIRGLGVVHLLLAPALLPYRIRAVFGTNHILQRAYDSIPSGADVANKSVILVNPPIDPFASYATIYREGAHRSHPKSLFWLADGLTELRITRVDAQTLSVRPKDGLWSSVTQLMLRSLDRPLQLGRKTVLNDVSFEVVALTRDARPLEFLVHFHRDLEDPSLQWLQWGTHSYVPFRPPVRGTSVIVPAVDMRATLLNLGGHPQGSFLGPELRTLGPGSPGQGPGDF